MKIVTPHYNFNLIKFSYPLSWEYLFVSETMDVRELVHLATTTTINTKHSLKASLRFGDVSLKASHGKQQEKVLQEKKSCINYLRILFSLLEVLSVFKKKNTKFESQVVKQS